MTHALSRSQLEAAIKFVRKNYPLWVDPNVIQTAHYPEEHVETIVEALKNVIIREDV